MHVCECVFVYVCVHVYVYKFVCACMLICPRMNACTGMHLHVHTRGGICNCVYKYLLCKCIGTPQRCCGLGSRPLL